MTGSALFLAVFLACCVEAVEALTIILAAGTARDWRSALTGAGVAVVALALVVAVLGPAVTQIPLTVLRLAVGGLLLVFGLGWLRKAILRASGNKALHDENALFAEALEDARLAAGDRRTLVGDWYAFTLSFKGVLLEGLEVVFIVLTFGGNSDDIPLAGLGAVSAVVLVALAGLAVRAPLAKVPENAMKFLVGVMLTSFGLFWGVEGAGGTCPGGDAALLLIAPVVLLVSLAYVAMFRRAAPPATGLLGSVGSATGADS